MKKLLSMLLVLTLCLSAMAVPTAAKSKAKAQAKISMKDVSGKGYKLSKKQKELWNDIMAEYKKGTRKTVYIKTYMTKNQVHKLVSNKYAIKEIRYADTDCNFGTYGFKTISGRKELYVKINIDNVSKMIVSSKKNEKKINKIVKKLKFNKKMTEEKAAIKIHDYLVDHIEYDYTFKKHNISDALSGSSVCSGYTRLYKAICNKVGLKCQVIIGYGNGGDHAWNRVKINGKWKYVDVTWDDTTRSNDYLLISRKQILRDHIEEKIEK